MKIYNCQQLKAVQLPLSFHLLCRKANCDPNDMPFISKDTTCMY